MQFVCFVRKFYTVIRGLLTENSTHFAVIGVTRFMHFDVISDCMAIVGLHVPDFRYELSVRFHVTI
jgi:hypothetical protein